MCKFYICDLCDSEEVQRQVLNGVHKTFLNLVEGNGSDCQ